MIRRLLALAMLVCVVGMVGGCGGSGGGATRSTKQQSGTLFRGVKGLLGKLTTNTPRSVGKSESYADQMYGTLVRLVKGQGISTRATCQESGFQDEYNLYFCANADSNASSGRIDYYTDAAMVTTPVGAVTYTFTNPGTDVFRFVLSYNLTGGKMPQTGSLTDQVNVVTGDGTSVGTLTNSSTNETMQFNFNFTGAGVITGTMRFTKGALSIDLSSVQFNSDNSFTGSFTTNEGLQGTLSVGGNGTGTMTVRQGSTQVASVSFDASGTATYCEPDSSGTCVNLDLYTTQ